MGAHGKLVRLAWILGRTAHDSARLSTEYSGQSAVNTLGNGKTAEMSERRVDVDAAREILYGDTLGYAGSAHHPRRAGSVLSDKIDLAVRGRGIQESTAVIGIQTYDIFVLAVMFFNIGEKLSDVAVNVVQAHEELLQINRQPRRAYAGY